MRETQTQTERKKIHKQRGRRYTNTNREKEDRQCITFMEVKIREIG